ncbi:cell division protein FtsW [Alphaproteobacteria bacterium]|nr:cell division protein FtsW [Alphaproteobacteria bacterium]GHS97090.1 cell division protein FtsW [Alphaproteobacteria bacterium]
MAPPNPSFVRRDASVLGRWWWTVDHGLLWAVLLLTLIGLVLSVSASPCVAARIGFARFSFVKKHFLMVPLSLMTMVAVSLLSPQNIRKFSLLVLAAGLFGLVLVLFAGQEIKGAKRWLFLFGFSLQPSEFVKPALLILVAWLLTERHKDADFPGFKLALFFIGLVTALTLLQPDIGMTLVIIMSCMVQIFIAGMPLLWVFVLAFLGISGLSLSYFFIPHVANRLDAFFHPETGDPDQLYQIRQSLAAFHHGGWWGCGPGEGIIKRLVPDAHADFVFSVAGEEYGLILCLFIAALFAFVVIRSLFLAMRQQNLFVIFSVTGLSVQFGLQAFINMATALRLIPTKGMTLPFVSYGGSSIIAVGLGMGMVLALTQKRHGFVGDL